MNGKRFWMMDYFGEGAIAAEFPQNPYEYGIIDEEAGGIIAYAANYGDANMIVAALNVTFGSN